MNIRPAALSDMPEVARVFKASRRHSLSFLPVTHTEEEDIAYFTNVVFPGNDVVVGEEGGRILGFIAFAEEWLNHLYLLPEAQGQGLGRKLLELAQSRYDHLQLWVFQRNEAAIRFYERNGFRKVKHTQGEENEEKEPDALLAWHRP